MTTIAGAATVAALVVGILAWAIKTYREDQRRIHERHTHLLPPGAAPMTLDDFLLARIAEDEEFVKVGLRLREAVTTKGLTARQAAHAGDLFNLVLDDPEVVRLARSFSDNGTHAPMEAERALDQSVAHRRIVEDYRHLSDMPHRGPLVVHAEWVCRVLATAYVNHPDYREEWRP